MSAEPPPWARSVVVHFRLYGRDPANLLHNCITAHIFVSSLPGMVTEAGSDDPKLSTPAVGRGRTGVRLLEVTIHKMNWIVIFIIVVAYASSRR